MQKYFQIKNPDNGVVASRLIMDLFESNKCKNALMVRSTTTGQFLDRVLRDKTNITRIIYNLHLSASWTAPNESYKINYNELKPLLESLNTKFDLICIDPFHEYEYSKNDFNLLASYLSENGIMISHDCYPPRKSMASPKFKEIDWSGHTYVAFLEFAYQNPNFFYAILNTDFGIGIVSKKEYDYLKNNFNKEKQEEFLLLYKNGKDVYDYFTENIDTMLNIIQY